MQPPTVQTRQGADSEDHKLVYKVNILAVPQELHNYKRKITQHNTNCTASHKLIFKIYILYEVIWSLFALFCLCFL